MKSTGKPLTSADSADTHRRCVLANRMAARLSNPRNRLVRCFDNGGPEVGGTVDRFTVYYLEPLRRKDGTIYNQAGWPYRGMSHNPFHPQGFGQMGEAREVPLCRMGRLSHVGRRIPFSALPADCQRLVLSDLLA